MRPHTAPCRSRREVFRFRFQMNGSLQVCVMYIKAIEVNLRLPLSSSGNYRQTHHFISINRRWSGCHGNRNNHPVRSRSGGPLLWINALIRCAQLTQSCAVFSHNRTCEYCINDPACLFRLFSDWNMQMLKLKHVIFGEPPNEKCKQKNDCLPQHTPSKKKQDRPNSRSQA